MGGTFLRVIKSMIDLGKVHLGFRPERIKKMVVEGRISRKVGKVIYRYTAR